MKQKIISTERFEICENCQKVFNVKELELALNGEKYCNTCIDIFHEAIETCDHYCSECYDTSCSKHPNYVNKYSPYTVNNDNLPF